MPINFSTNHVAECVVKRGLMDYKNLHLSIIDGVLIIFWQLNHKGLLALINLPLTLETAYDSMNYAFVVQY